MELERTLSGGFVPVGAVPEKRSMASDRWIAVVHGSMFTRTTWHAVE